MEINLIGNYKLYFYYFYFLCKYISWFVNEIVIKCNDSCPYSGYIVGNYYLVRTGGKFYPAKVSN